MVQSKFARGLTTLFGVVVVFGAAYALVTKHVPQSGRRVSQASSVPLQEGSGAKTPADVPNSVLQQITADVSTVEGVNEVFVNGDTAGGYDVSGTVDVQPNATKAQIDASVNAFLREAYSSPYDVKDVQVYILQNGNIVAGAGLGADVYKQLTSKAGVSNFSYVAALKGSNNNVQGVDEKWFSDQVPASP